MMMMLMAAGVSKKRRRNELHAVHYVDITARESGGRHGRLPACTDVIKPDAASDETGRTVVVVVVVVGGDRVFSLPLLWQEERVCGGERPCGE